MIVLFNGIRHPHEAVSYPLLLPRERWSTVDSLDSLWFGMKLGIAVIGVVMMGFAWRGILRSFRTSGRLNSPLRVERIAKR